MSATDDARRFNLAVLIGGATMVASYADGADPEDVVVAVPTQMLRHLRVLCDAIAKSEDPFGDFRPATEPEVPSGHEVHRGH